MKGGWVVGILLSHQRISANLFRGLEIIFLEPKSIRDNVEIVALWPKRMGHENDTVCVNVDFCFLLRGCLPRVD